MLQAAYAFIMGLKEYKTCELVNRYINQDLMMADRLTVPTVIYRFVSAFFHTYAEHLYT